MTIQELYTLIDGNYDQAIRVLRMDKLIDKHIRKLPKNGVVEALIAAGDRMDPKELFETAHAVKGICANLGLVQLSAAASDIAEEYRAGNDRKMTDEEVKEKLKTVEELYKKAADGIAQYEAG